MFVALLVIHFSDHHVAIFVSRVSINDSSARIRRLGQFARVSDCRPAELCRVDTVIDEGAFQHDKEFNYNRAVMPGATASLVIAVCRYGGWDTALRYMHIMLNSFNFATPGTMYEVSPDYGMFVQAWNIRGFNIPLIHYFFGIDPLAYKKEINLRPNLPVAWKNASIKNVIIGDNLLSISFRKLSAEKEYIVKITKLNWRVNLYIGSARNVLLNGKSVKPQNGYIILKEKENRIQLIMAPQHES